MSRPHVESSAESLRLLAAAERLRDETGYRWRFAFEQQAIDDAHRGPHDALGDAAAHTAEAEGRSLDWRQAADYARRARGERKRPHHGWASLTPTELQVVALVAEGLTNPEIAKRLFISRSTVKTHLEHIFAKLGVRSRSALAAEASRHTTNLTDRPLGLSAGVSSARMTSGIRVPSPLRSNRDHESLRGLHTCGSVRGSSESCCESDPTRCVKSGSHLTGQRACSSDLGANVRSQPAGDRVPVAPRSVGAEKCTWSRRSVCIGPLHLGYR